MAAEHWFRWHHGTVNDPKWRVVASRCVTNVTVGHVVAVWAAMMENASQSTPRGTLEGWNDEDVAAGFGFAVEQVKDIRQAMQGKTLNADCLPAWEKRQPKREDSAADRTKAWRERNKTQSDAPKQHVTPRDAALRTVTLETETETEENKRKKALQRKAARFEEFWKLYPNKKGRAEALAKWESRGLDAIADTIIADVKARIASDREWVDGYAPHGSTYVNGKGWEDELPPSHKRSSGGPLPDDDLQESKFDWRQQA